ncbi:MAG: PAS domain S-box protein [Pseudomonadota bacterium]
MTQRVSASATELPEGSRDDRLETLLKNLPGMAYRCVNLPHWPMDFVSDGCFELCGYQRSEIESQQVLWGDFTHPEMIDEVDRKVRDAADRGEPFEVEYRIIHRNGAEKWVWERGRVIDHREDGVAILEGFITDITDRKLAEKSLLRAEAFAQAVVESAFEGIVTLDEQGSIESFNAAAQRIFGYRDEEVKARHCRVLFGTAYYREFDQFFNRSRSSVDSSPVGGEIVGRTKAGVSLPLHLSINAISESSEQKFVVLIRDLSRQRAAEKEVREQRELLAHADRLNTLGEMAAGIAHEINQPLTAISMYAQSARRMLNKSAGNAPRLGETMDKLSAQAHRAGTVIERMQQLTRRRESQQEVAECEPLIREVHRLAEVEAQMRQIVIVLRLENALPAVRCDPVQIQQVILNLLRNGMESMHQAGNPRDNKIVLQAQTQKHGVKIAIIDSGLGISRELASQLYLPFTSTKDAGMGLGLSISRSIIEAHGSQLEFTNNRSGGATFHFVLPLVRERDS